MGVVVGFAESPSVCSDEVFRFSVVAAFSSSRVMFVLLIKVVCNSEADDAVNCVSVEFGGNIVEL